MHFAFNAGETEKVMKNGKLVTYVGVYLKSTYTCLSITAKMNVTYRQNQSGGPENRRKAEKVHFRHLTAPKTHLAVAPAAQRRRARSVCGLGFYKTPLCGPFVFET